jgi:hypothetical protein
VFSSLRQHPPELNTGPRRGAELPASLEGQSLPFPHFGRN